LKKKILIMYFSTKKYLVMKKLLFALALIPALNASAQEATVKKVLMEDFTGLKCGWCPEGTMILEALKTQHPANVVEVAMHGGGFEPTNSKLRTPEHAQLFSALQASAFPAGAIDRKLYDQRSDKNYYPGISMGRGDWADAFAAQMPQTAIVSVSFTNIAQTSAGVYEGDLNFNFSALPTAGVPLVAQVYVLEDGIAATGALKQDNYSASVQNGKSPLDPWFHNRTYLHFCGTNVFGWKFEDIEPTHATTPAINTTYTKHFTFTKDVTWEASNLLLVAYVGYNGTAANDEKQIMNAEEAGLGGTFVTSVANVKGNLSINNVYPNPATTSSIIKVEYNTTENAIVTLKVLNAIGQVVATPYVSKDIAGTHTIQWRASDAGVPAGTYVMQLSTGKNMFTQKISIQ
jgi:hypothetical protein